jgi:hypothetical protein
VDDLRAPGRGLRDTHCTGRKRPPAAILHPRQGIEGPRDRPVRRQTSAFDSRCSVPSVGAFPRPLRAIVGHAIRFCNEILQRNRPPHIAGASVLVERLKREGISTARVKENREEVVEISTNTARNLEHVGLTMSGSKGTQSERSARPRKK